MARGYSGSTTNEAFRDRTRTPLWLFKALNAEFKFCLDAAALPETALCAQQAVLNTTIPAAMTSAEALRKQAEELMKAAEAAEQRERNSAIRETVGPIQLQIAKAVVAVQKHVDGLVDAMSDLEKASEALRKALAK